MKTTYDAKVYEFATTWLSDYDMSLQYAGPDTLRHMLSMRIQDALESFVNDYKLEGIGK